MCARLARAAARGRALTLVRRGRSVPATGAMTREEPVMSHLKSTLVALAVAAGLAANAAMAAAQEAKIELTPFAGYYFASDLYGTGGTRVSLENDFTWGIRLTRIRGNGGFELGYTKAGSDAKLVTILPGQPRADIGHVDFMSFDIDFLGFTSTGNRVSPFGVIGIGWSTAHPEINAEFVSNATPQPESATLFNFNFGIGTMIAMSPKVSLRLEGRWRVADTNLVTASGIWCDPYGYCYQYASDWYNSGELTGGLSFALR
jgi:opacity protein-like surface antigen